MGVVTLTEVWDDLRDALQRPSLDTTRMNRWIMASLREFGYAFNFRELEGNASFVTVNGTTNYAMAADFRMLRDTGVRKTAPSDRLGKLKKDTREQYQRRIGDTNNSQNRGSPEWYHRFANLMFLRPIPDATVVTISYDYWKRITPISGAGDVSPFSDDWDDIMFTGALYRGFRAQGEHDRYINIRNDFMGMVRSRALDDDLEEFATGGLNIISDPAALENDSDG